MRFPATTINAMAATSLDIDDGHRLAAGLPGAAIIVSASATAEERNVTFNKYLCAIVLGYEAAIRVALSRRLEYNESTVSGRWSGVGAAVARAKLLNLSATEISHAILVAEQHAPRVSSAMHHGLAGSDVKEGVSLGQYFRGCMPSSKLMPVLRGTLIPSNKIFFMTLKY